MNPSTTPIGRLQEAIKRCEEKLSQPLTPSQIEYWKKLEDAARQGLLSIAACHLDELPEDVQARNEMMFKWVDEKHAEEYRRVHG